MKNKIFAEKSRGFTLTELVAVIVIIGILTAVAIPKYIDFKSQARITSLTALQNSLMTTVALVKAEYKAEGKTSTSTSTSVTYDGQTITVVAGTAQPAATATGIGRAFQLIQGFVITYATSPNSAAFNFSPAVANCNVVYNQTSGDTTLTSSGC